MDSSGLKSQGFQNDILLKANTPNSRLEWWSTYLLPIEGNTLGPCIHLYERCGPDQIWVTPLNNMLNYWIFLLLLGLSARDRLEGTESKIAVVVGLGEKLTSECPRHGRTCTRSQQGPISTWVFCLPFCGFLTWKTCLEGEAGIFLLLNGEDIFIRAFITASFTLFWLPGPRKILLHLLRGWGCVSSFGCRMVRSGFDVFIAWRSLSDMSLSSTEVRLQPHA